MATDGGAGAKPAVRPHRSFGRNGRPESSRKVGGEDSNRALKIGKYRVSYTEDTTRRMMIGPSRVLYDVYDDRPMLSC